MMEFLAQVGPVLLGILLLGILVAVHEFGHFMAARLTGIEVMEFAIGMGPKIVGWTGKKGTKFSLRWIPFGGFCAFYGEDDVEGKAKDDPRAYNKQAAWKRMITVAMGPVMNFVLALAAALIFCWASGVLLVNPLIGSVEEGSPAYAGGLRVGDYVLAINGADVSGYADDVMGSNAMDRLSVFQNAIANAAPGEELVLKLDRAGICASPGAACASRDGKASHVLLAMGLSETEARNSVRFSLGRNTTQAEIDETTQLIGNILGKGSVNHAQQ